MTTKICKTCKLEKDISEFKSCIRWFNGACKACESMVAKQYYLKNREKILLRGKIYDQQHRHPRKKLTKEEIAIKHKIWLGDNTEEQREYRRVRQLKLKYNVSPEGYYKMQVDRNFNCDICGEPEKVIDRQANRPKTLCVDHDHKTGKIRGLLCNNCNRALGLLKDNKAILHRAIIYLEQ